MSTETTPDILSQAQACVDQAFDRDPKLQALIAQSIEMHPQISRYLILETATEYWKSRGTEDLERSLAQLEIEIQKVANEIAKSSEEGSNDIDTISEANKLFHILIESIQRNLDLLIPGVFGVLVLKMAQVFYETSKTGTILTELPMIVLGVLFLLPAIVGIYDIYDELSDEVSSVFVKQTRKSIETWKQRQADQE